MSRQARPEKFEGKLAGFVYMATNPAMPGVVRVGRTQKWPQHRIGELYSSGTPEPFALLGGCYFIDSYTAETEILRSLGKTAEQLSNKKFFRMESRVAKCILDCHHSKQHIFDNLNDFKLEARIIFENFLAEERLDWIELVVNTISCLPRKALDEELAYMLAMTMKSGQEYYSEWLVSECGVDPESPIRLNVATAGLESYYLTAYENSILLGHSRFEKYLERIGCEIVNSDVLCWVIDSLINVENRSDAWKIRITDFGEKLLRKGASLDRTLNVGLFSEAPCIYRMNRFRYNIFPRNSGKTCREVIQMLASSNPYFAALNKVMVSCHSLG